MQVIEGILFEPVGCLAEFPSEPFNEIAARFFGHKKKASRSGSRSYWHLLNLMAAPGKTLDEPDMKVVEALECEAVAAADVYADVIPALSELRAMGIQLILASSLSRTAVLRFSEKCGAGDLFDSVWSRNEAAGVKEAPLRGAFHASALMRERTMYLTDTTEGLKVARAVGVNAILMMNDPDEAKRLAMREPAGGIVSLLELPDFVRFVAAENLKVSGVRPMSG